MGEIADGLIDGTFDYITGEYLGEGHGYPRSYENNFGRGIKGKNSSKNGVVNYLNKFILESKDYYSHCVDFINANQIEIKGNGWKIVADAVQYNWAEFVKYTNNCCIKKKDF